MNYEIEKRNKDIAAYAEALNILESKKDSKTQLLKEQKKAINESLKQISGGAVNIGNIQYSNAAYKRIEEYSQQTKDSIEKLEKEKIEYAQAEKEERNKRVAPRSTARVASLRATTPGPTRRAEGIILEGSEIIHRPKSASGRR